MSKENLEQFTEQVARSDELQAKIGEEIDAEALIALGAECGCEFTAEDLQEAAELSEEELDGVAGGHGLAGGGKKGAFNNKLAALMETVMVTPAGKVTSVKISEAAVRRMIQAIEDGEDGKPPKQEKASLGNPKEAPGDRVDGMT